MNSKFKFVNHSCGILTNNKKSLVMDPWIEGSVFNNSWNLLVKTTEKSIQSIKDSNCIWFSHEHPDHFNPPNIKLFGKDKEYLFQKTKDKRVLNFLKEFSSNVLELNSNETFELNNDFTIKVIPFQDLDSFCIIKIGDKTILNLNDCDIKSKKELIEIQKYSGKIDILMAQFSYAIGKSNKDDTQIRKNISNKILENLNYTISFLKPSYVIPFASFCYFSRYDNFYLNDSVNKIDYSINFLKEKNPDITFLCFYPGDVWDLNSAWNNNTSINKYKSDYNNISPISIESKKYDLNILQKVSIEFINQTNLKNNMFKFYDFFNYNYHSIYFKLTDIDLNLCFDFKNGLYQVKKIDNNLQYCELASDSLYQLFSSGYGYDALMIGGRFEANRYGIKCLNKIFKFQTKNYQNQFYNLEDVIPRFLKKFSKYTRINPAR